MSKTKISFTFDTRKADNWIKGIGNNNVKFIAKVYDKGSKYGIDKGRVSKLGITQNGKEIVHYDRGWDVKPATPEHREIFESVMARLNSLDLALRAETPPKNLLDKLEAAKEKSATREFDVTITETLQATVTIEANSLDEAKKIASDNWNKGEYTIDAEHFKGVSFEPAAVEKEAKHSHKGDER